MPNSYEFWTLIWVGYLGVVYSFQWKPFLFVEDIVLVYFAMFKDQLISISKYHVQIKYIKVTIFHSTEVCIHCQIND